MAIASLAVCIATFDIAPAGAQTYSGRAYAAYINGVYISDTGQLPSGGGNIQKGVPIANIPGVFKASLLNASTSGGGGRAVSTASLADVELFSPGHPLHLTASYLFAESAVNNCAGSHTNASVFSRVTFRGQTVLVSGNPNQMIPIPGGGVLIINEQSWDGQEAKTNALHLIAPGVEIILSGTEADLDCGAGAD